MGIDAVKIGCEDDKHGIMIFCVAIIVNYFITKLCAIYPVQNKEETASETTQSILPIFELVMNEPVS